MLQQVDSLVSYVVPTLAIASLLEFLLVRNFSRMGVFLPHEYFVTLAYDSLVAFGSVMFTLASLLVIILFLLLATPLVKGTGLGPASSTATSFVFAALALLSVLFLFLFPTPWASLVYIALSAGAVMIIARSVSSKVGLLGKIAAALIASTFLASYTFQAWPLIDFGAGSTSANPVALSVYQLGEILAVFVPVPLLVLEGRNWTERKPVRPLLVTLVFSAVFAIAYLRSPWLVSIISMWTLGFIFHLPFPFYLAAFAALLLLIVANIRVNPNLAYGLIFLMLAGRMMQLTYLNLLGILGFAFLSRYLVTQGKTRELAAPARAEI